MNISKATVSFALILVFVVVAVAAARPKWNQLDGYTFERYTKDFHRPYSTDSKEWAMRKKLFDDKMERIRSHNADASTTYRQGVNEYTDRTNEELAAMRGSKVLAMGTVREALDKKNILQDSPSHTWTPPLAFDYRKSLPPVLTAIKDQGNCGSCWAHAATEVIESQWAIKTGNLFVLSQQEITSCTPNPQDCGGSGGCWGAIAELAIDYIASAGGIHQEWSYPYTSYFGVSGNCTPPHTTPPVQVTGYTKAAVNSQVDVQYALVNGGPVAVSVDASGWPSYESGIFSGCLYSKNISMDHAVVLVGYGHDDDVNLDYWVVRNSWSPAWGENGFIRLLKTDTPNCGWNVDPQNGDGCNGGPPLQWTCGECGILYDVLYPNVAT